jgi:hypothetical protein
MHEKKHKKDMKKKKKCIMIYRIHMEAIRIKGIVMGGGMGSVIVVF